ncbi:hypothetical protein [Neobacillus massiliamazoniensis]|uniref:Uncharacterized protein n=1 Tax=Neobacillus massiliamazoniensis TaxID=1499688 RepID=A0A0U1NQK1_9BACI|nr:hypothetical protein [Neobacillus massiliamazoniensis]CRK80320.1 hypothetical protein BN000_00201 [Neobacillus massiliamazoniensis]
MKPITLKKAKEEIKKLQHYVYLVESYHADTLEKSIIKEYAITNSIQQVSNNLGIDREFVTKVIKGRGKDELHKQMRSFYMLKTRSSRR